MSARTDLIETAFAPNQTLKKRVFQAISETPKHQTLFEDIASYTLSLQSSTTDLPPAKKRKVEQNGESTDVAATASQIPGGFQKGTVEESGAPEFEMPDVSFSIPVRKKLKFEMWGNGFAARDQKTGEGEWYMNGKYFQHAFRLPVPEKAQKQAMLILLPLDGNSTRQLPPMPDGSRPEPAVFTIADNPKGQVGARIVDEKLKNDPNVKDDLANGRPLEAMLKRWIGAHSPENEGLIEPNEKEFASAIPEAHRKGEKAYHVRAFRGTKDGFLFLLSTGLIFTPKKPILFFPFSSIKSISYSSVVQRTFSLNVTTRTPKDNPTRDAREEEDNDEESNWETTDFEFSHIDQKDFAGIDAWVKKHELDDESLAMARKAKVVTVNKKKRNNNNGEDGERNGEGEGEGESELRKAEREIEGAGGDEEEDGEERDSEDEREEDYDPGSEGESEGSGTSDESDGEEEGHGGARRSRKRDGTGGKDLVEEELGSEAEDVEVEDEDKEGEEEDEGDGEEEEEEVAEEEEEGDVQETGAGGGDIEAGLPDREHRGGFAGPALDDEDQL